MDVYDLKEQIEQMCQQAFEADGAKLLTEELVERTNVDVRAIAIDSLYIHELYIAVPKRFVKMWNYYGGFEYVDNEYVTDLGPWVVYSAAAKRIQDVITRVLGDDV